MRSGVEGGNCTDECIFDESTCQTTACGNGLIQPNENEECEPNAPLSESCETLRFDEGTLTCSDDCRFDLSGCVSLACGDQEINGPEQCEPDLPLLVTSCADLPSYDFGELGCASNCTYPLSATPFVSLRSLAAPIVAVTAPKKRGVRRAFVQTKNVLSTERRHLAGRAARASSTTATSAIQTTRLTAA